MILRLAIASLFARLITVGMTVLAIALSVALFLGVEKSAIAVFGVPHWERDKQRNVG